jgi:hypothetical protein
MPGAPTCIGDLETYDPATGTFSRGGRMTAVRGATAGVLLPDGRVAVFSRGAAVTDLRGVLEIRADVTPVEVFDPGRLTTEVVGTVPGHPGSATLLRHGRILVTGVREGRLLGQLLGWAAIYDPVTGEVFPVADPGARLAGAAALPDGRVLLAGGWDRFDASSFDIELLE